VLLKLWQPEERLPEQSVVSVQGNIVLGNPVTRKRLFISNPLSGLTIICRLFQTARLISVDALFAATHTAASTQRSVISLCLSTSYYWLLRSLKKHEKGSARHLSVNVLKTKRIPYDISDS
jgi:hypothetical protein